VKREVPKPALSSLLKKFQSENVKAASSIESDSPNEQDSVAKQKEKMPSANIAAAAAEASKESVGKKDRMYFLFAIPSRI
jgi:hypothetical protein